MSTDIKNFHGSTYRDVGSVDAFMKRQQTLFTAVRAMLHRV